MYKLKFRKICSAAGYDTQGLRPKECIFSTYKHPSSRSRKRFSAKTEYQHFTNIEHKVGKILKLIHNNGQAKKGKILEDSKKRSALIELVEDFHKQYYSLYTQYDHLRAEMGKKTDSKKEKESSSSPFSSDSEYYSPDDRGSSPVINMHLHLETSDGTTGEL